MRLIKMFFFVLPSILSGGVAHASAVKSSVLVCYGRLNPQEIKGYNYVILESQYYNSAEIKLIKSQNQKVVAYISLGEVNANAPHYQLLKDETLGKNKIWNSYYLNLESVNTQKVLMDLISKGIADGYDGFFLDNIDNYTTFGPQFRQKQELIAFLKQIFLQYPNQTFVQNAGFEIINDTAPYVDAILVESVASNYTFDDNSYKLRDEGEFRSYAGRLRAAAEKYKLPIMLVEYADTESLKNAIEERMLPLGFEYFIGNIDLQTIPKFTN